MWQLASPKICYHWAGVAKPWIGLLCLLAVTDGLISGLWLAPPDYQQGDAYRILYIHAPAAVCSLGIYVLMALASMIYLVWKIKMADIVAKVSAPIGISFTLLTLISGAIWGRPTWGTYWIWDARLTSELILFFLYVGIIALRSAIPEYFLAARASGVLTLIGVINIPIIHYSVYWWNTLHQGATLLKFSRPSIVPSMLHPLLAMLAAFFFYYVWLMLIKIRSEILIQQYNTQWVKNLNNINFQKNILE